MCYLQLCLEGSSKVMIFETLSALLDIPLTFRFETDQILKMKFNPICIYSAIFWLSSTFPLALVCVVITVEKQSRHFSSFADLLRSFDIARFKSHRAGGKYSRHISFFWSATYLALYSKIYNLETKKIPTKKQQVWPYASQTLKLTVLLLCWIESKSNSFQLYSTYLLEITFCHFFS